MQTNIPTITGTVMHGDYMSHHNVSWNMQLYLQKPETD